VVKEKRSETGTSPWNAKLTGRHRGNGGGVKQGDEGLHCLLMKKAHDALEDHPSVIKKWIDNPNSRRKRGKRCNNKNWVSY